jgi:hypothetical protein
MIKDIYLREIEIENTQRREGTHNSREEVRNVQSWLCLQERANPGIATMTSIDGDFGPATESAVKNFQKFIDKTQNGIVTTDLFEILANPLKEAFEKASKKNTVRETILEVAHKHLIVNPFELEIKGETNSGPWVRSYMDGNEGKDWLWCMGFVQTVIDQAFSLHDKSFRDMMPLTYSCDTVGVKAIEKDALLRNNTIRDNPSLIKPGDIMLIRKSELDWTHTAIIISIDSETFTTIEGNTNAGGSRNGDGVYKRVRNFRNSNLDVFSIENWAN